MKIKNIYYVAAIYLWVGLSIPHIAQLANTTKHKKKHPVTETLTVDTLSESEETTQQIKSETPTSKSSAIENNRLLKSDILGGPFDTNIIFHTKTVTPFFARDKGKIVAYILDPTGLITFEWDYERIVSSQSNPAWKCKSIGINASWVDAFNQAQFTHPELIEEKPYSEECVIDPSRISIIGQDFYFEKKTMIYSLTYNLARLLFVDNTNRTLDKLAYQTWYPTNTKEKKQFLFYNEDTYKNNTPLLVLDPNGISFSMIIPPDNKTLKDTLLKTTHHTMMKKTDDHTSFIKVEQLKFDLIDACKQEKVVNLTSISSANIVEKENDTIYTAETHILSLSLLNALTRSEEHVLCLCQLSKNDKIKAYLIPITLFEKWLTPEGTEGYSSAFLRKAGQVARSILSHCPI